MVRPNLHEPGAVLGTIKAKPCGRPGGPALTALRATHVEMQVGARKGDQPNQGTDEMRSCR